MKGPFKSIECLQRDIQENGGSSSKLIFRGDNLFFYSSYDVSCPAVGAGHKYKNFNGDLVEIPVGAEEVSRCVYRANAGPGYAGCGAWVLVDLPGQPKFRAQG